MYTLNLSLKSQICFAALCNIARYIKRRVAKKDESEFHEEVSSVSSEDICAAVVRLSL